MRADHPTKAIFQREFHWQRPGARFGFGAFPRATPQSFPRDFIAAAIKAGAAIPVPRRPPSRAGGAESKE